jgi:hypothetical protein
VNLLLDSHTLLWLMDGSPDLSGAAAALIADPANRLYLSMASIWEIGIKSGLDKLGLSVPYATFLDTAINDVWLGHGCPRAQAASSHRHSFLMVRFAPPRPCGMLLPRALITRD